MCQVLYFYIFQVRGPYGRDGGDAQNVTDGTLSYCSCEFDLLVHVTYVYNYFNVSRPQIICNGPYLGHYGHQITVITAI